MEQAGLDTRWIILGTDGRHITLGQHTDPTKEELAAVEARLAAQGLAGWLVLMKGGYYVHRKPSLMMVRELAKPARTFEEAAAEFEGKRKATRAIVPG